LRGINAIENWHFYLAFSCFRLMSICQGVLKRALDGNASSEKALTVGIMIGPLAEMALDFIENKG
jgi:aminoglycoside phosphotransferase (APT) family kinase protein